MLDILVVSFVTFFTVIDPIGTVPVFIAVTARNSAAQKRKIAKKAALVSGAVLLFFIVIGEIVLNAIDIPISIFQISGGLILFLFSLTMIFGDSKPEDEIKHIDKADDKAIFPLAMPSLASPGAILAAVVLTDNSQNSITDQAFITLMMFIVLFIAWIMMLMSSWLFKFIGNSGASVISRVMGLILSAVAVSNVLEGISVYFKL